MQSVFQYLVKNQRNQVPTTLVYGVPEEVTTSAPSGVLN